MHILGYQESNSGAQPRLPAKEGHVHAYWGPSYTSSPCKTCHKQGLQEIHECQGSEEFCPGGKSHYLKPEPRTDRRHQCTFPGCDKMCYVGYFYCSEHSYVVRNRRLRFEKKHGRTPPKDFLEFPIEPKNVTPRRRLEDAYFEAYGVKP